MNGQNYDSIYDQSTVVQRMYNDGHQVASHTYVLMLEEMLYSNSDTQTVGTTLTSLPYHKIKSHQK